MSTQDSGPEQDRLWVDPVEDVRAAQDASRVRILEREGVAMVLALHDARRGHPPDVAVHDAQARTEGERLAELLDIYVPGLAADADPVVESGGVEAATPADLDPVTAEAHEAVGVEAVGLIDALVVLSDHHLRARPEPVP